MNISQSLSKAGSVSSEKVVALISEMLRGDGGYPDPDNPPPPGPWDPYIRRALDRLRWRFGPKPDPWRMGPFPEPWMEMGPHSDPWSIAALNPQPLPPRIAFMISLAQDFLARAAFMHEVASTIGDEGQKQGIIVVGGLVSRFVDDWCRTGWRLKWPLPGPPPPWWSEKLSGLDLVTMGVQFAHSAGQVADKPFQEQLRKASARLTETGVGRM